MSDIDNKDKPKLGARAPLGLKRTVETGKVKQSFSHGRSNTVVVEVKRRRVLGRPGEAEQPEVQAPPPPLRPPRPPRRRRLSRSPRARSPHLRPPRPAPARRPPDDGDGAARAAGKAAARGRGSASGRA
ncbi:translation initiation factor IF-2 associated domain-containing protein [Sphingomonas changnyeongensis]|uniref:translation initiation factor IF-2 associated domain-containing protein n=1 Tax=Sphingomonas changnyeongensis TaxID=2698679 RepID=UPI00389AE82E